MYLMAKFFLAKTRRSIGSRSARRTSQPAATARARTQANAYRVAIALMAHAPGATHSYDFRSPQTL